MAEQLLKMQGIEKRFSGVYALRHVDFTLNQGEVRGLIGENGAGKSTLMKVLGGDYQADAGKIYLNGQEIQIKDAETANQYGISFIHQELALFPELSIATNIFIQHLPSAHGVVKKREMHAKAAELLAEFGLAHCHPEQTVGTLQIGEQQLVEIMRCLAMDTKIRGQCGQRVRRKAGMSEQQLQYHHHRLSDGGEYAGQGADQRLSGLRIRL